MGGRKRGQVIIMFVLALFVLVGFVALGIDVGYMYSVRNDLQRSVDSGALAGAFAFHDGGWVSGSVPALLKTKAENRATFFATRDPVGAAPLPNGAITFANPYPGVNQIEVTAQTNVNLFFAGIIGTPTVMLSATAIAEAIPVDQNVECLTPLAFPYPYDDANNDNTYDPGETVYDSCNPADRINTLCQGGRVTSAGLVVADTDDPATPADVLNYNGQIFPLHICGDNSTGDVQARIADPCRPCPTNPVILNNPVTLMPDPTWIPTINQINASIISVDPQSGVSWDFGSNLPVSTHTSYSGDNWLLSPRVVHIMLYDPREAQATGVIRVRRFAGFWIWTVPHPAALTHITGYLVPDSAVGITSSSPILIEPSLKTTRLVQ